jgi:hypothetical protein
MSADDRVAAEEDDIARLLLLLTDILGDLQIGHHQEEELWTPESVRKTLQAEEEEGGEGGLALALQLVKGLHAHSRNKKVESWKELRDKYSTYWPPWVSSSLLAQNKPLSLISKIEVLLFLASSLQSKSLREIVPSSTDLPAEEPVVQREPDSGNYVAQSTDGLPQDSLSLPAYLNAEQKALIQICYEGFQADYDQRRLVMRQRLDIMACNFMADNKDDVALEQVKKKIQNLSLVESSTMDMDLSHDDLCKHFTTPHSQYQVKERLVPKVTREDHRAAVDRGGRTDGSSARTAMPKWVDKQSNS